MKQLTEILPDLFVVEVEADAVYKEIIFPDANWQYLGTCTATEISFDVSGLVEAYDKVHGGDGFKTLEESFRSFLLKHGLYWINPLGNKFEYVPTFASRKSQLERWQKHESSLLAGKLIFIKKK